MNTKTYLLMTLLLLANFTHARAEVPTTISVANGDATQVQIEMDASPHPWLNIYVTPKKEAELVALTMSKNKKWRLSVNGQFISRWIVEDATSACPAYLKFHVSSPEAAMQIAKRLLKKPNPAAQQPAA